MECLKEHIRLPRLNLKFHCNKYGSLTWVYVSNQLRFAAVVPSSKIHRRIRQTRNQNQYWTTGCANSCRNQRNVCPLPACYISPKSAAGCPRSHVDEHEHSHCTRAHPIRRQVLHNRGHQRDDCGPCNSSEQDGNGQEYYGFESGDAPKRCCKDSASQCEQRIRREQ